MKVHVLIYFKDDHLRGFIKRLLSSFIKIKNACHLSSALVNRHTKTIAKFLIDVWRLGKISAFHIFKICSNVFLWLTKAKHFKD